MIQVESFFPGRLRVRSPLFTDQDNMNRIVELAETFNGITEISGNIKTGSVIVRYDTSIISISKLMEAKEQFEDLVQEMARENNVD